MRHRLLDLCEWIRPNTRVRPGIPFEWRACESGACAREYPSPFRRPIAAAWRCWSRTATPRKSRIRPLNTLSFFRAVRDAPVGHSPVGGLDGEAFYDNSAETQA